MISLVRLIERHDRALEYDLMTRTGRTLSEYIEMGVSGRIALLSFIRYLPPNSALRREMDPKEETAEWYETYKTNAILADIFDAYVAAHTKQGRKAKEYPRPQKNQSIGKDAIPISKFWDWWNNKKE